jgi:hypothetical protein
LDAAGTRRPVATPAILRTRTSRVCEIRRRRGGADAAASAALVVVLCTGRLVMTTGYRRAVR